MKRVAVFLSLAVFGLGFGAKPCPADSPQTLTYVDLVKRLTDLEGLAVLPLPGEQCAQCSSYDRASKYDEKTGKYVHWDANGDGGGIIRREGKQVVMAEMEGPGCIWRIWSAAPGKGHVRIFLDGAEKPAVDLPFTDYFTAKNQPFVYPTLSYDLGKLGSSGQNLYFPIPYQKSCKILADPNWGSYYHFTFSTFPKGTRIPTFQTKLPTEAVAALKRVDTFFQTKMGSIDTVGPRQGQGIRNWEHSLAPGETATVARLKGPEAIAALQVGMTFKDRADQMAALRRVVLKITWDGQDRPGVWCPLGDFFGTAPGENHFKTLPVGMAKGGYYSYWYMPFAREAVIQLVNEDEVDRRVQMVILHCPLNRPFEGLGHFHAKWHRDVFPLSKDRFPDWVMLRTQGRGRFCGVNLHVWDPKGGWWGEGDEKFFVDGEKFPSTFGTGSEDYFGYAWGHPGLFQRAYHAQTMTQNNAGHQGVLRWHIVDNVPFQKSFEACIEKYQGNERPTLYACTAYWYLAPVGVDPFQPVPVEQRHGYYVRGTQAAGGFKILGEPPGVVQTQGLDSHGRGLWKNDDHLWWTGAKPGDKLTVALPVQKAGTYRVSARLTKAHDYGIVQLYLDGAKAALPIDLFNQGVIPTTPPVSLGTHKLTAGEHKLTVEIVGANPKAVKGYMFGLDEVFLEPTEPGWRLLFNGQDFSGWQSASGQAPSPGWVVQEGAMVRQRSAGDIWTKERFGNFVLDLDFKTQGNSGIFIRTDKANDCVQTGIEIQIDRPSRMPGKHSVGAIYDALAPTKEVTRPGQWNHATITVLDSRIAVVLNGQQVIDMDLDKWTESGRNPDGTRNKFRRALKDFKREGHIGFQDHGAVVAYRNIRIRNLVSQQH